MIRNFSDFCNELLKCGFSMGGGNAKGIFAVVPYTWEEQDFIDSPVKWHTGDSETDPWEWRIRVLDERDDIAYSKLFFNLSGYITKEWYPYFYAVRRGAKTLESEYSDGNISMFEKRIYSVIRDTGYAPVHEIKRLGGFSREDKSRFDRALTSLQMKMYVTMCGKAQKISRSGEVYGWSSTAFCTVESFWGNELIKKASRISPQLAEEKIRERILLLNPDAKENNIRRFITDSPMSPASKAAGSI